MSFEEHQTQTTTEEDRTTMARPWSIGVTVLGVLALVFAGVRFAPQVAATVDALAGRAGVRDIVVGGFPSYQSDRLEVALSGVTAPPQGSTLQGYLLSADGGFFCGDLPVVGDAINHSVDAQGRNLIGLYDQFQIMQQQTRFDVSLPTTALFHLRQVTSSASDTPGGKGYTAGLAEQADLMNTHAGLARDSLNDNNLVAAKQHIEHVLNILYGQYDPNYGDQDGDTVIEDPGDGLGVLFYASQADTVLGVVANAADVSPHMAERVTAAQTAIGNFWTSGSGDTWSTQLINASRSILNSSTVAQAQTFTPQLLGFANRIAYGADLDDDGIEPIPGEGGALTAFRTSQEAADYLPPTGSGFIGVRQSGVAPTNDKVVISLSGIGAPAGGNQLWGYLVDDQDNHLPLGALTVSGDTATLEKSFPGQDMINRYSRFYLTEGLLYADDQLPLNALTQLRIATSAATNTPGGKGYAAGLAEQAALIDTHAKLAQSALAANDLTVGKQHVEHVLNILYGAAHPDYGDQDGDTVVEDPGDGFGTLAYAENSHTALGQVPTVGDVSSHMAERSTAAQTAIGNFWSSGSGTTWSTQLISAARSILSSTTVPQAQGFVPQLVGFSNRLAFGSDLDDDGVEPILGEGGALTVFRTAQEAADYFPEENIVAQPTATPTATATATTTAPTATATSNSPTGGDAFEDDNSCQNAKSISIDGSLQTRTFHAEGDSDWVQFTAQAGRTYVIRVENLGAKSDAVVFLYDVCNASPDGSQDNAFGTTVTLEWDSTKNGQYFIELRQFDPSQFGSDANYRISVTQDTTPPATPKNPRCVAVNASTQAIQWERSPERDVVGYRLSYTRRGGGDSGIRNIDGATTTYYELANLTTNATYDVELRAVDYSNNLSDPTKPALPCTVVAPSDSTIPSLTVQQPTSGNVFTSTAEMLTIAGVAQDTGGNLSRVNAKNLTTGQEKWDFSLVGSNDQFRVEDLPLAAGANQIQLTVFDEANNASPRTITINRLGGQAGAAIIIAGHNETFGLQTNIYNSTNRAYRVFKSGGFSDDNIYYIAPVAQDADNDGTPDTDAVSTPAEFQEAIVDWAKTRVGPGKPLFLYMMDHGLENKFCVNGCGAGKFITPDDLDGWLRTLETATGVTEVTVIYEACLSGSFVQREGATGSISKLNRVIITSTGAKNNAYASAQGAYFSDAFFSCVADSGNMRACFNEAKDAVSVVGVDQTPFMDDNGDGIYNANDGTVAQNRVITRFFSSVRPTITAADLQVSGVNGTLSATIEEGAEAVELVWAAVFPPSFTEPTDVTLNLNMPVVRLEPVPNQPGRFSVLYPNGFTEQGSYRVVFYAQDRLGINAAPAGPGTGQTIYLPVVSR